MAVSGLRSSLTSGLERAAIRCSQSDSGYRKRPGFWLEEDAQSGSYSSTAVVLLPTMNVLCAGLCPILTHGVALHLDAMGVMDQSVENAIGQRGIADLFVPL